VSIQHPTDGDDGDAALPAVSVAVVLVLRVQAAGLSHGHASGSR